MDSSPTLILVPLGTSDVSPVVLVPRPEPYAVGRAGVVATNDPYVSASHAELIYRDSAWFVVDQHSRNGTFVNGFPVTIAQVSDLCEVRLGPDSRVAAWLAV